MKKGLLLVMLTIFVMFLIDQLLFFTLPYPNYNNTIFCKTIYNCDKGQPFRKHPTHTFLIEPNHKDALKKFLSLNEATSVEKELTKEGFRQMGLEKRDYVINVFGDSFTFGARLPYQETFTALLNQESSKCTFRNYGVMAFSLRQMLHLSKDTSLIKPANENLFLAISDDVARSGRTYTTTPFQRNTTFWDIQKELNEKPPLFKIPALLVTHSFFFFKVYQVLHQNFWNEKRTKAYINYVKTHLPQNSQLFFLPSLPDFSKGSFNPAGVPKNLFVFSLEELRSISDVSQYFLKNDGHPNAKGNRLIANKLKDIYKDKCF